MSNVDYWTEKIQRNVERDERTRLELGRLGWTWRVIWECETLSGVQRISKELREGRNDFTSNTVICALDVPGSLTARNCREPTNEAKRVMVS